MILCKYIVSKKVEKIAKAGNKILVELEPVEDGEEVFKYALTEKINLGVLEPEEAAFFVVGDEYHLDMTPVEKNESE